MQELQRSRQKH